MKTIQRINKSRSWFFEKTHKIDKPLTRLIHKKRETTQTTEIRNEKEVKTNTTEFQRIIRNYYKQVYAKKFDNLGNIDKFLETYNLLKLNQEEGESLNRPITADKIEVVIKTLLEH